MKDNVKKDKFISNVLVRYKNILILAVITLFSVVLITFSAFRNFDYGFYDLLLSRTKEVEADNSIVLLDIDDESLSRIGAWPWPRDIVGDVLLRLKEFEARQVVFDIEYLSPAEKAVAENFESNIYSAFGAGQQEIAASIMEYAAAVEKGIINSSNASENGEGLVSYSNDVLYEMLRNCTDDFSKDNDDYFGRTVQFFGNVSLTVNMRDISIKRSQEEIDYAQARFLFGNVTDSDNLISRNNETEAMSAGHDVRLDFVPVINPLLTRCSWIGFPNVVVDSDGVRRRVELLGHHDGKYVGQLAFGPLMKSWDAQGFERTRHALIVKGVLVPGESVRRDIKIPVDRNGCMNINWLHKEYAESFRHVPVYLLRNLDLMEDLIVSNLSEAMYADMEGVSEEDSAYVAEGSEYFMGEHGRLVAMRNALLNRCKGYDINGNAIDGGLTGEDYDDYFTARKNYFSYLREFTDSFEGFAGLLSYECVSELKKSVDTYFEYNENMRLQLMNSFCLIGNSATASTDIGVNPYSKNYANLGTHANVINTVMHNTFIKEVHPLWAVFICFAIALAVMLCSLNLSPTKRNLVSSVYVAAPLALFSVLMISMNIYMSMAIPAIMVITTYAVEVFFNFREVNRDKKFLQTKFGAYVSPDVVKAMQKNPQLAELGAQNKNMTALFSDVKAFSGFTETLNNELGEEMGAIKLQQILSDYLGFLTKEIMGQRGTVDKFVGDEIVSFFNAPLDDAEHAFHGCVAGIRMLQAEARYNEEFRDSLPVNRQTGEKFCLHSRVGLNTGYMAVGNMGTADKMNYTVMGNAVNLASRLEGTNKVYGSWIMCSDATWQEADRGENKGKLVARKFDCVRVINVKKPVQIHNILGLRNELPSAQVEAADLFNEGIKWYLRGCENPEDKKDMEDFRKALAYFRKAKECYPLDESSDTFIRRCDDFLGTGSVKSWDGVYTMTQK